MKLFVYDLETIINCFLFSGKFVGEPSIYTFEMSDRKNEKAKLLDFLAYLQKEQVMMMGYNSLGFDYPIIHNFLMEPYTFDSKKAYLLAQEIIGRQNYGFTSIPFRERLIPQLDLVKINHFDNEAKRTRLKDLQFAMRSNTLEDMPYPFNEPLALEHIDEMIDYNIHDILKTEEFYNKCKHMIEMRKELQDRGVVFGDVYNYSDVKIGVEYLVNKIGRQKCYKGYEPIQTPRKTINIKDIILPKIYFRTEEYQKILDFYKSQVIHVQTKERPKLEMELAKLQFHFGVGGVHASVSSKHYQSNDEYVIKDIDVGGMYVAVALANGFAPEHLGKDFTLAYSQIKYDRAKYPKGSHMNALLKLAGNGVYGNSNNPYSCFYDPKYTFSVTINGQLQLMQLVEVLYGIPGLEIIQANTDGITAYVPRSLENWFDMWCRDWEKETGLQLEEVTYTDMWIRDVNNYIAVDTKGKVKRKGAYWFPEKESDYDGVWNKNFSNMISQRLADLTIRKGLNPEHLIRLSTDPFDFMLMYKTKGAAKVYIGDKVVSKTVRYYVSTKGEVMKKIAPPTGEHGQYKRKNKLTDDYFNKILNEIGPGVWDDRIHTKNKSKYTIAETRIEAGRLVKECNNMNNFNWLDVDFDYYVKEVEKLLI